MKMTPEIVTIIAQQQGFKRRGRANLVRQLSDVLQLINLQKSNFSDDWYVNFALWPKALGEPDRIAEHLFPLRGRIEDIVGHPGEASEKDLDRFFDAIDARFSTLESLKSAMSRGELSGLYVKAELKALLS